nr:PREDICTED: DNA-directed RNA polymerase I subunit RPA2 isoform X3 [Megachile rotundata]
MLIEPKLTNTSEDFNKSPEKQNLLLQSLGTPHIDSFNYMLEDGLSQAVQDNPLVYIHLPNENKVALWIDDVSIHQPIVPSGTIGVKNHKIYPTECRQRGCTYKGKITVKLGWSVNGKLQETLERDLGEIPIMIKSNRCHLHKMSPKELIAHGEHEQEWGGYFIIKGLERIIRMLLMTRRNYPIAIKRSGWKARGVQFSDLGLLLRSVRDDNTASNNTLHYVIDGSAKLMFTHRKVLYYVPLILILKCLIDASDIFIYNALTAGCEDDPYYKGCILNMLRAIHEQNLHSHEDCKTYIGRMFRIKFFELPQDATDTDVCDFIIKHCIAIHLDNPMDKFYLLVFMTKKLFALANNKCAVEGADAVMMQECLLGGHLYLQVLKEKLYSWLNSLKMNILKRARSAGNRYTLNVPRIMEIVLVPKKNVPAQYPGLYLFTNAARMMRPVMNLASKKIEYIGTFEQVYLNICVTPEEAYEGLTTHQELSKTAFLSNLASLIPMPDCNQSPRNMYQCQMGKQTMGTPCHTWQLQSETKLYRLQTPATPFFRPVHYDKINLDDFAMGTNAIVAVISYTGYDMEDAMIINKAAYDRGFAHGMIYKSEFVDLKDQRSYFARNPDKPELAAKIDVDGLPVPGTIIKEGDIYYCYYDADQSTYVTGKYHGKEDAHIDNVKLCGTLHSHIPRRACITFRISRNPSVGDKFASRAGQKGICSQKWPAEDLPFTETGLIPDIVFNPHGFPSRMTIAMMIEVMAGKSAAIHGLVHDATSFRFNEDETAVEYFGKLLERGGYNYYGTERLYSGIDGREMTADIFFGIVHYQRLRHMVSDKWQVRSTGPIDVLTRQPIKGRRRGGGVRFGEMERDSLISHGCAFLLQDRLFHCSDKTTTLICQKCGTLLGPVMEIDINKSDLIDKTRCRLCSDDEHVKEVEIPYIFRYLVTQLTSCNINVKLSFVEK